MSNWTRRWFACWALSLSLLLASAGFPVTPQEKTHDFKSFQETIERELNGKISGGYAFAVLYKGRLQTSGAWGWARRPGERVDPSMHWTTNTPINIASVSKVITAVGLLRLWDEKHHSFSLDDPIWVHLRALVPTVGEAAKKITIRQVLQHKSGLPEQGEAKTPETLGALLRQPLAFPPGSRKKYDNRNYYIVRLLIEAISGGNYAAYVKQHVLAPMNIHDMNVKPWGSHQTLGYASVNERNPGIELNEDSTYVGGGAGGWYGTANDMALFLGGLYQRTVLSEVATQELMKGDLGWDYTDPCYSKGGDWGGSSGAQKGEFHAAINYYPDGVEAVLLANGPLPKAASYVLNDAWYQSGSGASVLKIEKFQWLQTGNTIHVTGIVRNPTGRPQPDVPLLVTLFSEGSVPMKQQTRSVNVGREELNPFELELDAGRKVAAVKVEIAKPGP